MVKEGNKAPDFSASDQSGNIVKLSSFRGKKNVVLYFYPKDMTPGCTTEACDFRDQFKQFKNTEILGVSIDSPERHQKQEKKLYGKTFMGIVRSTFIIDKAGVVRKIFPKVKVKGHVDEVADVLKNL
jgi:peroxiredoxin Q/BCP